MNFIDLKSIYIFIAFMSLVEPIVTWVVLRSEGEKALNKWCYAGLFSAVGTFLAAIKGANPSLQHYVIANAFLIYSAFARAQALLAFNNERLSTKFWLPLGIIYFASVNLVISFGITIHEYCLFAQSFIRVLLCCCIYRVMVSPNGKKLIIFFVNFVIITMLTWLIFFGFLFEYIPSDFLSPNPFTILMAFLGGVAAIIGYISVVGFVLERSRVRKLKLIEERATAEASTKLTAEIFHSNRQQILSEISAAIAHEISSPLSAALACAKSLEMDLETKKSDRDTNQKSIKSLGLALNKISVITQRVRNFIKYSEGTTSSFNLKNTVEEVIDVAKILAKDKEVVIKQPQKIPSAIVIGDPVQISQVLLNLIVNAINAVSNTHNSSKVIDLQVVKTGLNIHVTVNDNGSGFDEEDLSLFGKPFTSRTKGGLGLGLWISHNIIEKHKGFFTLSNLPDGGASVSFSLPLEQK